MHKHNTVAWSRDPGQDTGYILRALLGRAHTPRTSQNSYSPVVARWLKLGLDRQKGEAGEKLQRTTLISLIELSKRDCCNYDYL